MFGVWGAFQVEGGIPDGALLVDWMEWKQEGSAVEGNAATGGEREREPLTESLP